MSLIFPAQYRARLHPTSKDFFALAIKSYFKAFIEISSEINIPLNFNFFLIIEKRFSKAGYHKRLIAKIGEIEKTNSWARLDLFSEQYNKREYSLSAYIDSDLWEEDKKYLEIIKSSDHVIDLGPLGGNNGGEIVFQGNLDKLLKSSTITAESLKKSLS